MNRLAMFIVTVTVGSSTIVNIPGDNYFAIIPKTCSEEGVGISTTPVPCVPAAPVVSTGPFILKAGSGDCYRIPYINPNGTIPKTPADWVVCP